jgi:hypothetical protein
VGGHGSAKVAKPREGFQEQHGTVRGPHSTLHIFKTRASESCAPLATRSDHLVALPVVAPVDL